MSLRESLLKQNGFRIDPKKITMDTMYYGTEDYFKEKLGDRLPDEQYELMELRSQLNMNKQSINEGHINYINSLKEQALLNFNMMMNEFKEKEEEEKDEIDFSKLNINEKNIIYPIINGN